MPVVLRLFGRLVGDELNSVVVLVRREVAEVQLQRDGTGGGTIIVDPPPPPPPPPTDNRPRPRRFYARITLDPNRPTPQVSNIAQSILSELDRVRGTKLTLTLDIDAQTADGFPEDIESVVRDNAVSLRITDFGFERE